MAADDISSPLDRIDRALARLEAAAVALPAPQAAPVPQAAALAVPLPDADLIQRHQALRASVAEAIASLDALLARGDG